MRTGKCLVLAGLVCYALGSSPIGVDIGHMNSVVSTPRQGGVDVIVNEESRRQTPSIVAFDSRQRLIGSSAANSLTSDPANCISEVKALLGLSESRARAHPTLASKVCGTLAGHTLLEVECRQKAVRLTVQQLLAMLLYKLECIAKAELGASPSDCTIAVPMHV